MPKRSALGRRWVVNIVSFTGTRACPPITATSVAKTAQIRFGEGLALELKEHGISVFSVHPGIVRTRPFESHGFPTVADKFDPPDRAAPLCAQLATGRYDALSGRFLTIDDNLDDMLTHAEEIAARDLYTLRLTT